MTERLTVSSGDILVLVGTTKGAFLFRTDPGLRRTEVSGPHFPGEAIYALAYDGRAGRQRVLAGTESSHWGSVVRHTDDLGATWTDPAEGNVRFPADAGAALTRVWQLTPADDEHPEVVYAGVEPAALFRSGRGGSRAAAGCACIRCWWIPTIPIGSGWPSRPGASTTPRTAASPGAHGTRGSARSSSPTRIPSSASASTRSPRQRAGRSACTCRTTGACTAPTTPGSSGSTSPTACRATSGSR